MKILQVVGYKKSGKTSLVNRWVKLCKEQSLKVATLKHHGHNSPLEMPGAQADSMQHFLHGADRTIVYGAEILQVHQRLNEKPSFKQLVDYAADEQPDILFIEGFKQETYPKVVLLKDNDDWKTLSTLSNVKLVITPRIFNSEGTEILLKDNQEAIDHWLFNWLEG